MTQKKVEISKRTNWYRKYTLCMFCVLLLSFICFMMALLIRTKITTIIRIPSGFYENTIEVELRRVRDDSITGSVELRYNLNGDDLSNTSIVYDGKIRLEAPDEGYKLYTITAAMCEESGECSRPETAVYVLGKNLKEDVRVGIVNINSSQESLYDYNKGIFVRGITYDLSERDQDAISGRIKGNYDNRGENWQRLAYVTMFNKDGEITENGDAYIEVSGGGSSFFDVKSLKTTILYDDEGQIFEKEFRLRSGSQDQFSGNIRSSVVSRLAEESDFDGESGTERVVVFLNGEFYGIFDKQMNYSKQNLALKYDLKKRKYVVKYKGSEATVFNAFGIKKDVWLDLDKPKNRERLEGIFDMDNYLKYYAIQILINNYDWPINNFEAWKYGGQKSDNKYEDGRIRFLIYDADITYYTSKNIQWTEGIDGDTFEALMEDGRGSTFGLVMESEYYSEKFINLLRELMDGPFATENVLKIIDEEAEKIEHQVKLFYSEEEYEKWEECIDLMRGAAEVRNDEIKDLAIRYFGVWL